MLTFVSADIDAQRRVMAARPNSPLYLKGSREVTRGSLEMHTAAPTRTCMLGIGAG